MNAAVEVVLYVIAAVCFALAAWRIDDGKRVDLLAVGLLAWILVPLLTTLTG